VVSDLEVNTADYDLPVRKDYPDIEGVKQFPFALHPISVHAIEGLDCLFSELVGPLTPALHLRAQSYLVELPQRAAEVLQALPTVELEPAMPKTALGLGRVVAKNSKLAPKHEGQFLGKFADHEIWYVYSLVLYDPRMKPLAVKLGYASDPHVRCAAYNLPLAHEVTGLQWRVDLKQPVSSEDTARVIEQAAFGRLKQHRLQSNGEILTGITAADVATVIALELRSTQ
jgi:hypothetical protein